MFILEWSVKAKKFTLQSRTTNTQWRHKSKISEKLGQCGRQNMLWLYQKIWEWEWIFGRAVKAISSLGVRSAMQCIAGGCPNPKKFTICKIWEWVCSRSNGLSTTVRTWLWLAVFECLMTCWELTEARGKNYSQQHTHSLIREPLVL